MKSRWLGKDVSDWLTGGHRPALVLTGARQVGKTTLARSLASEGTKYLALDDPVLRSEIARLDAGAFARRFPRAILDEAQKLPQLFETVKAIVDQGGRERYLLLGSSHVLLLDQVKESLVGRTQLRQLGPLSLAEGACETEFLTRHPAPKPFLLSLLECGTSALTEAPESVLLHPRAAELVASRDRLLDIGGMPGLWDPPLRQEDIREELETYVALYLERDLADLARLRDLEPFVRLQRLAAERTGCVLNASELARDAGLSHETAKNYLRYLELSFQVIMLQPWFSNASKRLIRSPRLHWLDVGVWKAVTRRWSGFSGQVYESAVVSEFLKVLGTFRTGWKPYHLRTYDRREIDLLLVRNDECVAFEIKSGERVHSKDARHLRGAEEASGLRCVAKIVVYRGRETVELDHGIWAIPDVLLFGDDPAPLQNQV